VEVASLSIRSGPPSALFLAALFYVALAWSSARHLELLGRSFGWSLALSLLATPIVGWLEVLRLRRRLETGTLISPWVWLYLAASTGALALAAATPPGSYSIELNVPGIVLLVALVVAVAAGSTLGRGIAFAWSAGVGLGFVIVGIVDPDSWFLAAGGCYLVAAMALVPQTRPAPPRLDSNGAVS
jgi:hypothetical protein